MADKLDIPTVRSFWELERLVHGLIEALGKIEPNETQNQDYLDGSTHAYQAIEAILEKSRKKAKKNGKK